ncbi:MAG: ABC transporter substrate-binding protein [Lachnospiraceae bacterium]|nr:ABC transporter substrate-binding protein [Lachnospiraceae bacterium]
MKKSKRKIALLLVLSMMVGLLGGCSGSGSSTAEESTAEETEAQETAEETTEDVETTEDEESGTRSVTLVDGYVVEGLPEEINRIAALFGPSYERLVVLGAEDRIVACASMHQSSWPWASVVYKYVNSDDMVTIESPQSGLNVEDLLQYDLDVCFYWRNEDVLKALENVGIAAVPYNAYTGVDSIKQELYGYAQVLGDDEAMERYEAYAEYWDETLAEVTAVTDTIPESERKTVYFAYSELLSTIGQEDDLMAVIEYAGGIPVSSDLEVDGDIDKEQLISWNPDYIFTDHTSDPQAVTEEVLTDKDYANITAVMDENVYSVPSGVFYWDAGVGIIMMIKWMAVTMYPEYFPDVDMTAELQDFYAQFYDYDLSAEEAELMLQSLDPA